MPDDVIRITLPPEPSLVAVASVAVRAAARQVAMPDHEIDRLRLAVVEAFTTQAAASEEPIELILHPEAGHMRIEVGSTSIE